MSQLNMLSLIHELVVHHAIYSYPLLSTIIRSIMVTAAGSLASFLSSGTSPSNRRILRISYIYQHTGAECNQLSTTC